MSRYRQDVNADSRVDLDPGFIGVNTKLEPSLLRTGHAFYDINQQLAGPGIAAGAVNMRFDAGVASTRRGGLAVRCYNAPNVNQIYGGGTFSDPNGRHWVLLASESGVNRHGDGASRPDNTGVNFIGLPAGGTTDGPVDLVQAFDKVIMFRGSGAWKDDAKTPLQWDGDITNDFEDITATSSGDYTSPIPSADTAVVMGGRLFCAATRDQVAVSDVLDYTRWDATLNAYRLNTGEDDAIVALHPYRRTNLLVFKDQSVYVLANTYGDLSDVRAELINGDLGCAARDSVATVGSDVFWLDHSGVYRLTENVENSMVTQEVPVSDPIEPLIRRINPAYIDKATAVVHGKYYRLAVPLDDSTVNNVVLVFDTTTGQWQGYDTVETTGPTGITVASSVDKFLIGEWHGRRHVLAVRFSTPKVDVLEIDGSQADITSSITTRGYVLGDSGIKRFRAVNFALSTLRPTLTFESITEGQGETVTLESGVTRDRTKYAVHGKTDYDITNTNADHAEPYREDYSVYLGDGTIANAGDGVNLDREQSWSIGYPVRQVGRWVSFKITNTTGHMTVKTVTADATVISNRARATF